MEVDLTGSGIKYEPGDSLGVLPENSPALVQGVLQRLKLKRQQVVCVLPAAGGTAGGPSCGPALLPHLGTPCTLEAAFTRGCDLTGVPR